LYVLFGDKARRELPRVVWASRVFYASCCAHCCSHVRSLQGRHAHLWCGLCVDTVFLVCEEFEVCQGCGNLDREVC
jgi:hypothetical protein